MPDIIARLANAPSEPARYAEEFREETRVLPALCGLPRIIRAFPPVVKH